MTKKQRALEVIEEAEKEYPDAGCTLDYDRGVEAPCERASGGPVHGTEKGQQDRWKLLI